MKPIRHWQDIYNVFDDETFMIKVSTGCLNNCSYCSIRQARPKFQSQPMQTIWDQFEHGLSKGFKKFGLIGTDLSSYGKDLGTTWYSCSNPWF